MNNKPTEVLAENVSYIGDRLSSDRQTTSPQAFPEKLLFTENLLNLDPRILQRYSIDDNGGGYKGL